MAQADALLTSTFKANGAIYKSGFYPVGHSFNIEMQDSAFDWLEAMNKNG